MEPTATNRKCSACNRALTSHDEWITLDGGETWCAECWRHQFGMAAEAPPQEKPSLEEFQLGDFEGLGQGRPVSAGDATKTLRPCTNCGQLCAPDAEVCPACGGEPFGAPAPRRAQGAVPAAAPKAGAASADLVAAGEWQGQAESGAGSRGIRQISIGQQHPQAA